MRLQLPFLAMIALVLVPVSCGDPAPPPGSDSVAPPQLSCAAPSIGNLQPGDSLVVTDTEALCTIEFGEVTRLRGPAGGPDPQVPVALGPGGTYVTNTYSPGELAVWSARGEFLRIVGEGPGSGPGEFEFVSSLLVDADSVIHVLPGQPQWHRYAWSGDFLETVRVPMGSSTTGLAMAGDGTLVAPALTSPGVPFLVWRRGADSLEVLDSPAGITNRSPAFVRGSAEMGIWSLQMERYLFRRHDLRDFGVDAHVVREAHGLPRTASPAFAVDDRGLLWAFVSVPAPDAPPGPRPPAASLEERRAIGSRYRNVMIEVLALSGHLLASRTYEELGTSPRPITADRWYRVEDDPVPSIVILEPRLVER